VGRNPPTRKNRLDPPLKSRILPYNLRVQVIFCENFAGQGRLRVGVLKNPGALPHELKKSKNKKT
jgi:hypothetical protein